MAEAMHPLAPHHLPGFITRPGETDPFLTGAAIFLVVIVLLLGSLYFRLHALPEKIAHRGASHQQFQLVAVLSLLALFTHNNVFWVAALLLAFIPVPDFWSPLANMAESLARMADWRSRSTASLATASSTDSPQPLYGTAPQAPPVSDHSKPNEAGARPPAVPAGMDGTVPVFDQVHRGVPTQNISPANPVGVLPAKGGKL